VAASELDTTLIMRAIKNTERVMVNQGVKKLQAIEKEKGEALDIKDIIEQVAGIYPKVMIDGDVESGAWSCGMVAGLIHDVPTCEALIDRIMLQAEQLIRQRLVLALN
jgi:nitronate monooxygenase